MLSSAHRVPMGRLQWSAQDLGSRWPGYSTVDLQKALDTLNKHKINTVEVMKQLTDEHWGRMQLPAGIEVIMKMEMARVCQQPPAHVGGRGDDAAGAAEPSTPRRSERNDSGGRGDDLSPEPVRKRPRVANGQYEEWIELGYSLPESEGVYSEDVGRRELMGHMSKAAISLNPGRKMKAFTSFRVDSKNVPWMTCQCDEHDGCLVRYMGKAGVGTRGFLFESNAGHNLARSLLRRIPDAAPVGIIFDTLVQDLEHLLRHVKTRADLKSYLHLIFLIILILNLILVILVILHNILHLIVLIPFSLHVILLIFLILHLIFHIFLILLILHLFLLIMLILDLILFILHMILLIILVLHLILLILHRILLILLILHLILFILHGILLILLILICLHLILLILKAATIFRCSSAAGLARFYRTRWIFHSSGGSSWSACVLFGNKNRLRNIA